MLSFAVKLTVTPSAMNDADVDSLRTAGFSDRDILDIVEVVALLCVRQSDHQWSGP